MSTINNIFRQSDPFEQLIENIIALESTRKNQFIDQRTAANTRRTAINQVGTRINSLNTILDRFAQQGNTNLSRLSATSSDSSAFSVTVGNALLSRGEFDFEVLQTARNDQKVSDRFTSAAQTLATVPDLQTEFFIQIGDNPEIAISVTDIDAADTDRQVLQKVANAINQAAGQSVRATVLSETDGTSRLSVRSLQTGFDNRIAFRNEVNVDGFVNIAEATALTNLGGPDRGEDNTAIVAGVSGGRIVATSALNALFRLDGLDFERTSNTVTNAINGLNIQLIRPTTGVERITIDADAAASKESVNEFISAYNSLVTEIRSNSFLNRETGARGPLSRDREFRELVFQLRDTLFREVRPEGYDPNLLAPEDRRIASILEIGLDFRQDGTLFISDNTRLDEALLNRGQEVQELFSTTNSLQPQFDGITNRVKAVLDGYVRTSGGLIPTLNNSIDERIRQLDDRIRAQDVLLENRRSVLRRQFQQLQQVSNQANSQFNTLLAISGNFAGF